MVVLFTLLIQNWLSLTFLPEVCPHQIFRFNSHASWLYNTSARDKARGWVQKKFFWQFLAKFRKTAQLRNELKSPYLLQPKAWQNFKRFWFGNLGVFMNKFWIFIGTFFCLGIITVLPNYNGPKQITERPFYDPQWNTFVDFYGIANVKVGFGGRWEILHEVLSSSNVPTEIIVCNLGLVAS